MTEGAAAILGATVGAAGGLAGGWFAALASLRASQVAARAPLADILTEISNALVRAHVAKSGLGEFDEAQLNLARKWSEFSIHQRILCPSETIANLMDLILKATKDLRSNPDPRIIDLASQTVEKITRMVAAHSNHVFRFRARKEEKEIVRRWLESAKAKEFSAQLRAELEKLT